MRLLWAFPLLIFASPTFLPAVFTQQVHSPAPPSRDSLLFEEKKVLMAAQPGAGHAALALAMGRSFLGLPYVSGTLDRSEQESLVINFSEMDCWTHVECSVALALTGPQGTFEDYRQHLRKLRYWGGTVEGYGSRLHYFTGWLLQAEKLGILQDLTRDLGGIPYAKRVGYISARPQKYPKIKDELTLRQLRGAETRINKHSWFYIPKARVSSKEHLLREGDLIVLTSAKADLDVSHQGFAVRRNGRIHLLHASSLSKKVIISAQPLAQYLAKQRGQSGIMVARLL
ncbi:MAG TPA: DUF1460 domain-containing protein [Saprospiraceae bacterium]|nr:DUF1460 domain-containing protein [Saprospiraceae bacterium]